VHEEFEEKIVGDGVPFWFAYCNVLKMIFSIVVQVPPIDRMAIYGPEVLFAPVEAPNDVIFGNVMTASLHPLLYAPDAQLWSIEEHEGKPGPISGIRETRQNATDTAPRQRGLNHKVVAALDERMQPTKKHFARLHLRISRLLGVELFRDGVGTQIRHVVQVEVRVSER